MKPPGINLAKLKGKVGSAPTPTAAPGPTAAELAAAISARDNALRELGETKSRLADAERAIQKLQHSLDTLPPPTPGIPAAAPTLEDTKKVEKIATHMNAAVDGIITLIEAMKVPDGSPVARVIDDEILPALEELDKLLPKTN
jgi:hypothetical protein